MAGKIPIRSADGIPYPRLSLLGLPGEIRSNIYTFAFLPPCNLGSQNLFLLLTCRQIYHEAHTTGFDNTFFPFSQSTRFPTDPVASQVMKTARKLRLSIIGMLCQLGVTKILFDMSVTVGFEGLRALHIVTCLKHVTPKFGMGGVTYLCMGVADYKGQVMPGTTQLRELGLCCECGECRRLSTMDYLYSRWSVVPRKKRYGVHSRWNQLGEELCDYTLSADECWFRVKYPAHAPGGKRELIVKLVDFSAAAMHGIGSSQLSETESEPEYWHTDESPEESSNDAEENMEQRFTTEDESSNEDYEDYYDEEEPAEDELNREANVQNVNSSGESPPSKRPRVSTDPAFSTRSR